MRSCGSSVAGEQRERDTKRTTPHHIRTVIRHIWWFIGGGGGGAECAFALLSVVVDATPTNKRSEVNIPHCDSTRERERIQSIGDKLIDKLINGMDKKKVKRTNK